MSKRTIFVPPKGSVTCPGDRSAMISDVGYMISKALEDHERRLHLERDEDHQQEDHGAPTIVS